MMSSQPSPARLELNPDRLFPAEEKLRNVARELYSHVEKMPIISPHGHVPAEWLADNTRFTNPTTLLLTPDHYTNRLLHSVGGVELDQLGVPVGSEISDEQAREAFRLFASNWKVFRGTQVQSWYESQFVDVFGIDLVPSAETADQIYDHIDAALATDDFLPRSLYKRFNIEALATTDDPCDDLAAHAKLAADPTWDSTVVPTFRPDAYLEPARPAWRDLTAKLARTADVDISSYADHVEAMRIRRQFFKDHGAVSSDHSHSDTGTARLSDSKAEELFQQALKGEITVADGAALRRHMLNDQARLAVDDGLVMTLHPGVYRNHDQNAFERYGADVGGDIPTSVDFVEGLQPLLSAYGNAEGFQLVLFTMDETVYSRELAPLAGWYRSVYIGAPWWFIDETDAMLRFRRSTTGYSGFGKASGFIDDTRAFCSIPSRHDAARRVDSVFLAHLVTEHRLTMDDATQVAIDLVSTQPKKAFKL